MVELASTIWADGPTVDPHEPNKQQIRVWCTWVEGIITAFTASGGLIYSSLALLNADLAKPANSMAWVIGDPVAANNGVYGKVGASGVGSWTRRSDLPFSFIVASDVGAGTPNAILATSSLPISQSALVWLTVAQTNTASPVTVTFNSGATLTVRSNSGNDIAPGGLVAGMTVLGIVTGATFRLVSDQASAAIAAAAEAALADFRRRYLGALASDPSTDLSGNALIEGALYFNSTTGLMRVRHAGVWQNQAVAIADGDVSFAKLGADVKATANLILTVGSGGTYATINAALAAASRIVNRPYASGGVTITVRLLTGFVMNEQVLVAGVDLSFITITSVDAVVYINPAGVTAQLEGTDSGEPAFGVTKGGQLPNIGAQFEYQTQQTGTKRGVAVFYGSKVRFIAGSGVRKSAGGLLVYYDSEASVGIPGLRNATLPLPGVYGVDFSDTEGRALDVHNGSRVSLPRSKFNTSGKAGASGDASIYGIWGVHIDVMQSEIKNSKVTDATLGAVRVRDGSTCCFRECDISGSAGNGYYFSHGTVADCRFDAAGPMGFAGAANCAGVGLLAASACVVDATELICNGCGGGGVRADYASMITFNLGRASNCTGEGIASQYASTIEAYGAIADNNTLRGVYAFSDGRINFETGHATGNAINIFAHRGSRIHAESAVCTGSTGTYGITAQRGSHISAFSINARIGVSDNANDIAVFTGSSIAANSGTGGVSQTANTPTANGIIYK